MGWYNCFWNDPGVEQSSLQGRCYSETATSPVTTGHHVHPLDVVAPEEVLKHHQLSASDAFSVQRQRSTTDVVRRTKIKRFPTIMTPSYGRSGNGISKGPLLRGQFYSKTEKMTVLSPDMEAKIYEKICRSLGAKYGSLERATQAAVTIQKMYRGYKLRRHFEEIRREGNVQLFRRCSLDAREKRNNLTMGRRDKAAAGAVADPLATAGSGGRAMERGVVQVGSDSPPPHAGLSQTGKGGQSAMDVGVAMEGVVLRRSKSHSAVLTKRIREEGEEMEEEEDEEEEGENGWNKTVGVHLFNSPTSAQPTLTPDVAQHGYDVLQDGGVEQSSLQGRCYSETATSPVTTGHHVHPLDVVAPEEVLKHHQLSASDAFSVQRQRSTTDVVRRTKIKRFPTIMTPSYGRSGNGISKGPLPRGQFYSKTEKMTVLSPDMEAKIYEKICRSLGAKYGSLERATQAAVTIQKTYRGYKLLRHFEEIHREGNVQLFRRCSLDAT
eukprot:Em0001g612a